ncbi:MAG: 23S rRNA (uracil(1939)-C(5))-methyltransferase RlmD [Prevotella sp.]|nr:23S rRNA (uracil(1939)-C(5))-methyltransferase RlmD [Staphylococcus sp.]MCM1349603.1 23S rRNA (uracil(1939)-C(5))-methyltransferase RlmD [Prevotella sp.]
MTEHMDCPLYGKCGGCQRLNQSYSQTLTDKLAYVNHCFQKEKLPIKVKNILEAKQNIAYRNKMIVGFRRKNGRIVYGFYEENSHQIVPQTYCPMHSLLQNQIANRICSLMEKMHLSPFDEDRRTGLIRYVLIKEAVSTQEILVTIVVGSEQFGGRNDFVKALRAEFPQIKTIIQNVNMRKTSVVLGDKEKILYGPGYIQDELCGFLFQITSKSFYQVNPYQTALLYQTAIDFCQLTKKDIVLDAYSGIGTIGMIVSPLVQTVLSVENNKQASLAAIENVKRNQIKNVRVICDDATNYVKMLANEKAKIDVVIMDPPRTGSTPAFLKALGSLKPRQIVYISCGPDTLATDLSMLLKLGYGVTKITCVDMFCWTNHVETVVLLSHKGTDKHINVKVDLGNEYEKNSWNKS